MTSEQLKLSIEKLIGTDKFVIMIDNNPENMNHVLKIEWFKEGEKLSFRKEIGMTDLDGSKLGLFWNLENEVRLIFFNSLELAYQQGVLDNL